LKITFLGSGTSHGIPIIGCRCEVCSSLDYRDKRLRSSILIEKNGKNFIIDSGPDFRQQVLREKITQLDAILFTHEHKDHTAGLDDVRSFNYRQHKPMPVFGVQRVLDHLKIEFAYAFTGSDYPGIPKIILNPIHIEPFVAEGEKFIPIEVLHHKLSVLGFRTGDFSYVTDANYIAPSEIEKLKGSKVLILNALQQTEHLSHYNLKQALEVIEEIKPEKAFLTHIGHNMGLHKAVEKDLPSHVRLGYDGLKIELKN